jgi:hypothetical protein
MTDGDSREESEKALQDRLTQREAANKFLEELALLCKEHGVYLEGHGEDSFLVHKLTADAKEPMYKAMWDLAPIKFPLEICWCPNGGEGLIDL